MRFLLRLIVNAVAVLVAAYLIPGIHLSGFTAALIAGLVLGLVNAVVKPLLFVLTLPFTLITLGLFIFVVNAICLGLVAALVRGFSIDGFWSALFGAVVISLVSWLLSGILFEPRAERR